MKVSIIVPCYAPDVICLDTCTDDILNQTVLPYEVIFVISEINEAIRNVVYNKYNDHFSKRNIKFQVFHSEKVQFEGRNRNIGTRHATGDILMFIDCDDEISKYKIEITIEYMQKYDADVLFHGFAYKMTSEDYKVLDAVKPTDIKIIDSNTLYNNLYPQSIRDRKREMKYGSVLCANMPGAARGFATIRRKVADTVRFEEKMKRGPDSMYMRDCIWNKFNVIVLQQQLMNYFPIWNSKLTHLGI